MTVSLSDFSDARVLVVGDVMLDHYWHGSTSRISPEAPVPIVRVEREEYRPGGAGNVALNIAALGGRVELLGVVGDDPQATHLENCLRHENIVCHLIKTAGMKTITKLRVMSQHQQLIRLDFEEITHAHENIYDDIINMALKRVHVVVLSDYAKGTLKNIRRIIAQANKHHLPIIVDPKAKDFSIYRGATLLTPNFSEFEAVVGRCENDNILTSKAQSLCQQLELGYLLVTRGEQGMILVGQNIVPINFPVKATEVFDVTGAGDTVVAAIACSLSTGKALDDAVAIANVAAGLVVGKSGTASVTIDELNTVLYRSSVLTGVVTEDELVQLVKKSKLAGEHIVMTNGCFDILHAGHIKYLFEARKLGDKLIVAVNDDASVTAIKGMGRPINELADRMLMLASLKCVDWVVSFSEMTPERIIHQINPDILVKGSDYHIAEIVGGEHVKSKGGDVRTIDFVKGHSTTSLINRIQHHMTEREST